LHRHCVIAPVWSGAFSSPRWERCAQPGGRCGAGGCLAAAIHAASSIDDDVTPFLYAMTGGVFRRFGIDADLQRATSGSAVAAGVVGGAFELGKSSITSLCAAHVRGVPLSPSRPAVNTTSTCPRKSLDRARRRPPQDRRRPRRQNHGRLGAQRFLLARVARMDRRARGDSTTIKLTEIPMSQAGAAVITGRIDAAIVVQPYYQVALADPKIRVIVTPRAHSERTSCNPPGSRRPISRPNIPIR